MQIILLFLFLNFRSLNWAHFDLIFFFGYLWNIVSVTADDDVLIFLFVVKTVRHSLESCLLCWRQIVASLTVSLPFGTSFKSSFSVSILVINSLLFWINAKRAQVLSLISVDQSNVISFGYFDEMLDVWFNVLFGHFFNFIISKQNRMKQSKLIWKRVFRQEKKNTWSNKDSVQQFSMNCKLNYSK